MSVIPEQLEKAKKGTRHENFTITLDPRPECTHPERPRYGWGLCQSCYTKAWARANPRKDTRAATKRGLARYGLTIEGYEELCIKQDGKCAICGEANNGGKKNWRLHVDHDHETQIVRGLLCSRCNLAIGHLREDSVLFYSAMEYLAKDWIGRNYRRVTLALIFGCVSLTFLVLLKVIGVIHQ
jgi:Recombination endonuclease VII